MAEDNILTKLSKVNNIYFEKSIKCVNKTTESSFKEDLTIEQIIGRYLDKYLYSEVCTSFKRLNDTYNQKSGKDILLSFEGQLMSLFVNMIFLEFHLKLL